MEKKIKDNKVRAHITLSKSLKAKADYLAWKNGFTFSAYVDHLILSAVEKYEQDHKSIEKMFAELSTDSANLSKDEKNDLISYLLYLQVSDGVPDDDFEADSE